MSVISKGLEGVVATDTRLGDVRGRKDSWSTAGMILSNSPVKHLLRRSFICFGVVLTTSSRRHTSGLTRRALREVDRSQWTIPKVQACEKQASDQAYPKRSVPELI